MTTSVGSTVLVEPVQSSCSPKQIIVGRVITPLFGDGWIPVKVINIDLKKKCEDCGRFSMHRC